MITSQLATLIRTIAPLDFPANEPLYVAFASELPEQLRPLPETLGLCSPWFDLVLKPFVDWQGRGPAMVLNDVAIRDEVFETVADDPKLAAEIVSNRLIAVALHETGHMIDRPVDYENLDESVVEKAREVVFNFCRSGRTLDLPTPWFSHELPFIRVLMHLVYRAEEKITHRVPLSFAFASANYGLSSPWAYQTLLGSEPERFRQLSLSTIKLLPVPSAFESLFLADTGPTT